jgi:predicted O-methyltransferase YrrM
MPILDPVVEAYLDAHRSTPDALLSEMEAHGARDRVPIVPPETGALLHVLARTAGATRIVEVGTAIGVSTVYLARALPADGELVSFEIDPARHAAAQGYLGRAGVTARVDLRLQDAREGLAELDEGWDLAFIDATKGEYATYFELLVPRMRPRGLIVADNALLSGTVATGEPDEIWSAQHIRDGRAFLEAFLAHPELDATVLAVGDGVAIGVKRG